MRYLNGYEYYLAIKTFLSESSSGQNLWIRDTSVLFPKISLQTQLIFYQAEYQHSLSVSLGFKCKFLFRRLFILLKHINQLVGWVSYCTELPRSMKYCSEVSQTKGLETARLHTDLFSCAFHGAKQGKRNIFSSDSEHGFQPDLESLQSVRKQSGGSPYFFKKNTTTTLPIRPRVGNCGCFSADQHDFMQ